jgi:hypothetical protein
MTMANSMRATGARDDVARTTTRHRIWSETKPSPKTTELWFMIIGVVALAIIYNAASDVSLDLFRACLLGTMLAMAYIVSRGLAKAASHDDYDDVRRYDGTTR